MVPGDAFHKLYRSMTYGPVRQIHFLHFIDVSRLIVAPKYAEYVRSGTCLGIVCLTSPAFASSVTKVTT